MLRKISKYGKSNFKRLSRRMKTNKQRIHVGKGHYVCNQCGKRIKGLAKNDTEIIQYNDRMACYSVVGHTKKHLRKCST